MECNNDMWLCLYSSSVSSFLALAQAMSNLIPYSEHFKPLNIHTPE